MSNRRKRGAGVNLNRRLWANTVAGKLAARRASEKSRTARRLGPHCGARRKQDGEPCQMPALENGRCRLHGGLTPRGSEWHRVQYPKPGSPSQKVDKKLLEIERRRKRQARRVAAMSPERRAKYEAQSQAAQPRTLREREHKRHAREAAKLISKPVPAPVDPQLAHLQAKMVELDVEEARLKTQLAAHGDGAESIHTEYKDIADER